MNEDGTIKAERKISLADMAGFDDLFLLESERFGRSLGLIGDLQNDGTLTLAVGAGAGVDGGAIWLLTFAVPRAGVRGPARAGAAAGHGPPPRVGSWLRPWFGNRPDATANDGPHRTHDASADDGAARNPVD